MVQGEGFVNTFSDSFNLYKVLRKTDSKRSTRSEDRRQWTRRDDVLESLEDSGSWTKQFDIDGKDIVKRC